MISKTELDEIITRRIGEGKTLAIANITDEEWTSHQIKGAAIRYYGSWTDARRSFGETHKVEMSREEVVAELKRLQHEGHSMIVADLDQALYRRICDYFGGYKNAKKELGISQKTRYGDTGAKARSVEDVLAELKSVADEIVDRWVYNTKYKHLGDYSRRHFGDAYKIFDKAGLERPGYADRKPRVDIYWTKERIAEELPKAFAKAGSTSSGELSRKGYRKLVDAVSRRFGTWNAGLVANGYEVAYERRCPSDNLTKEQAKNVILKALSKGTRPTFEELAKIPKVRRAIRYEFEGIDELKEYCGFCAVWDKPKEKVTSTYRADLTTASGIIREITRLWYIGVPLNYTSISERRRHLLQAANKVIGSWRQAVEMAGIEYSEISKTSNILSECGEEFEEVFADILTDLGYEYLREGEGVAEIIPDFNYKPDFILPNWRWIDCKLSEWTDSSKMLKRYYEENPNGITIVYLRGRNRRIQRGRKWKYEHTSVYQFTKQLPQVKRDMYEGLLREIEEKAENNDEAV